MPLASLQASSSLLRPGLAVHVSSNRKRNFAHARRGRVIVATTTGKTSTESEEGKTEAAPQGTSDKSLEMMRKFSEQYVKRTGTYFCVDKGVTAVVIKGLAEHKEELGAPLCPCRHYDDKEAEVKNGFWNCPCVPMRERKECHCMLFLTEDNGFAGTEQSITLEEVKEKTQGL